MCSLDKKYVIQFVQEATYMFRYIKDEKGFILADAMIGMIIITTALIAVLAAYTQTTRVSSTTTARTHATYLAQRTLEDLKRFDGGAVLTLPEQSIERRESVEYTINARTINVNTVTNTDGLRTYLLPVQVTVTWQEKGQNNTLNMISYYYIQ